MGAVLVAWRRASAVAVRRAIEDAERRLDDAAPVVRGAAVWALSRLVDAGTFAALREVRLVAETSDEVRAEWTPAPSPECSMLR